MISPGGIPVTTDGAFALVANYHWDTGSLAWVKTTGSTTATNVSVSNFPSTQAVTQSGTWTVQPGNTANTTAWKVDGSAVTQPVSAASLPLPAGAATEATLSTLNGKFTASNSQLRTLDTVNGSGVQGAMNVTNASATAIKVGGSAHANRKLVTLYNSSSIVYYWGWTDAVTSSTGTPIQPQQFGTWNAGPDIAIYVIAASGTTNDSRVTEAS